jgi:GntR family transcriptional regulator
MRMRRSCGVQEGWNVLNDGRVRGGGQSGTFALTVSVYDTVVLVIHIDLTSDRPLEEQIALALRQVVAQGTVEPGAELPSVRQLAGDLGVHWNTVARAYRRLAAEGLLIVRRGRGVVVKDTPRTSARLTKGGLREQFAQAVAVGLLGGLSRKDVIQAFEEALADFGGRT